MNYGKKSTARKEKELTSKESMIPLKIPIPAQIPTTAAKKKQISRVLQKITENFLRTIVPLEVSSFSFLAVLFFP